MDKQYKSSRANCGVAPMDRTRHLLFERPPGQLPGDCLVKPKSKISSQQMVLFSDSENSRSSQLG